MVTEATISERRLMIRAMNLSFAAGVFLLVIKVGAWLLTGSTAILSDAAESVVHIAAVTFASFSLRLSLKPADRDHPYGHAKAGFLSAGFEGATILLAALFIIYHSVMEIVRGPEVERLGLGVYLTGLAILLNGVLGYWLLRLGRSKKSVILEANGTNVLTDCWTSLGVVLGLGLAWWTGWLYWDPILAILLALNIIRAGVGLVLQSAGGLMDRVDPEVEARLRAVLDDLCPPHGMQYHQLRHRNLGDAWWVELHLLFPKGTLIENAHAKATEIEDALEAALPGRAFVSTHLEPLEGHDRVHSRTHFPHRLGDE